ncbi:MAG: DUF6178 family protein [Bdellovibrionota bacterium]
MASRLSEENSLISIYDAGHLAVSLTPNSLTSVDKAISPIDLATVMKSPNAVDIIQKKSPIEIYRAIKLCDPELLPEVLEAISEEQFTGILDFDTWKEDRLIAKQVFSWLKLYAEISPKELYKRFSSLEEEYQLATLGPYIRIYDQEEYEKMPESFQDRLITLPSNDAYYEITAKDQETFLIIENLIEAIMANNMSYAISLLAHSAYMPPAEQEELLSRFRRSRIEEEGYVSYNESLSIFAPYAFHDLTKKIDHWNTTLSDS